MLELKHVTMGGPHIHYMPFTIPPALDELLAPDREAVLPIPVPFSFGLPTVIDEPRRMSPVMYPD